MQTRRVYTHRDMWEAYRIGLSLGLGIALGVLLCGLLAPRRALLVVVAVAAAAAGAGIGYAIGGWHEALAGGAGGAIGTLATGTLVTGAVDRGGTRGGTAAVVGGTALVAAGVAFIPFVGYLEAAAVPALAARARRRRPARYAGLRSLARD
jgi:hypothetical protein